MLAVRRLLGEEGFGDGGGELEGAALRELGGPRRLCTGCFVNLSGVASPGGHVAAKAKTSQSLTQETQTHSSRHEFQQQSVVLHARNPGVRAKGSFGLQSSRPAWFAQEAGVHGRRGWGVALWDRCLHQREEQIDAGGRGGLPGTLAGWGT